MAHAITLARTHVAAWHIELLRRAVVLSCAGALIAAGRALPF